MPHKEGGRTYLHTVVNEHFQGRPVHENVKFKRVIRLDSYVANLSVKNGLLKPSDQPREGVRSNSAPRSGGGGLPRDGRTACDKDAVAPVTQGGAMCKQYEVIQMNNRDPNSKEESSPSGLDRRETRPPACAGPTCVSRCP
jgi:hypothetical protein